MVQALPVMVVCVALLLGCGSDRSSTGRAQSELAGLQKSHGGSDDFHVVARGVVGGDTWKVWLHRCASGDPCLVHSDPLLQGGGTKLASIGRIVGSPVEHQLWLGRSHPDGGSHTVVVGGAPPEVALVAVRHRRREVVTSTVAVAGYGSRFFGIQLPLGVRDGDRVTVKAYGRDGRLIRAD